MPDAGVLATILLIVGLFLLALELMVPSFGMIGILSAISLLISAWSAWQAWWGTSPGFFWTYAAFWLLGIPSVMGGVLFLLQNTSLGDHIVLRGPAPSALTGHAKAPLQMLIGETGKAASLMMPGGIVVINNERFHAETRGMVIESGSTIQVIDVKSNRLVVRQAAANTASSQSVAASGSKSDPIADTVTGENQQEAEIEIAEQRITTKNAGALDFEIPES